MAFKLSPVFNDAQLDSSGNPYTGAKLFTYVSGSTTKQTAYQDSGGLAQHTNPIVLNSRGEPPAPIWLTEGLTYKLYLTTPADSDPPVTSVRVIDNVSGVNDTTTAQDEWKASGHTPTYISAVSFSVSGDQTGTYTTGRRLKTTNSGGTVYSTVSTSSFGASITTVAVINDSSTLDSGLSAVNLSILRADNSSIPSVKLSSGNWSLGASFATTKDVTFSGTLSPAQITSSQNDYSPTGLSTASTLRLNTDASRNITGLAGGADGRILTIVNVGTTPLVLTNQDTGSVVGNRFLLKSDTTLALDQSITLRYDGTTARWRPLSGGVTKQQTRQIFTSSSGTYTTPAGSTRIFIRIVGGGGGGAGRDANAGGAGGNTTFSTLTANGGGGGVSNGGGASSGGTASGGDINFSGQGGNSGGVSGTASVAIPSGSGGNSPFGGAGFGQFNATGGSASANSGSGGGGGGGAASTNSGGGGGAGGYCEKLIVAPAATYSYGVGAAGSAGSAGGQAGGQGGAGLIIVDEFYD